MKKTTKKAIGLIVGGAVLFPVLVGLFWAKFGDLDVITVSISLGISSLVELIGVALLVNARRSAELFRDGMAVMGKIRKLTAPPDRQGNAYLSLEVEFLGGGGTTKLGKVTAMGNVSEIDLREGGPVPVLYSVTDPRRFAIYSPGLGMMAGVVST